MLYTTTMQIIISIAHGRIHGNGYGEWGFPRPFFILIYTHMILAQGTLILEIINI